MPKSYRHTRMARKFGTQGPEKREYHITDAAHRPDLRGEFAGAKVRTSQGRHVVSLSARQAKFYLDQGALSLVENEQEKKARLDKERNRNRAMH